MGVMWLLIAVALDRAQLKIGASTYGSAYCGIGCVDAVNQRQALSPMAYRVLIPWLIGLAERLAPALKAHRLPALYEPMKIGLLALTLASIETAAGRTAALVVAALLPMTFYFDYWDWAAEMAGFALALTGHFEYALVGAVMVALSRETAPLVAVIYALITREWVQALIVFGVTGWIMFAMRCRVGYRPLYCERWMWRVNWSDLQQIMLNRPVYLGEMAMSLLITALAVGVVLAGRAGAAWPVPLVLLVMGWTMARAPETRVFAACLIWIGIGVT